MNITKISAKYIIGYQNDSHVIYENAELVYLNDTVIYIGHNYQGDYNSHIDAKNAIVSPGFIDLDALGDIDHSLIFADQPEEHRPYLMWNHEYFLNRKEQMTLEEESFKSYYAYANLISNGITTAMPITSVLYKKSAETYEEIEAAAENAGKLGLRVYLGPSYASAKHTVDNTGKVSISPTPEDGQKGFQDAVKFAKNYHNKYDGLIQAALVPERIELQTEEILKESKKIAKELNCPIRLHAAQGILEYNFIQEWYKKSPIAYLNSIGFLDERTSIPHAFYTSGYHEIKDTSNDDLDILRDTKTTVIHCPLVYSRSGKGLDSFGRYQRYGINMAMGTDTFPCDMIDNMRTGAFIARHLDNNAPANNYTAFFNAATLGGAKALGRDDIGRLCVGSKADIIIIDLNSIHTGTIDDPIKTMFLQGTGRDVHTTIINGKIVMQNRIIANFDYEQVIVKAQNYYEKLKESYVERSLYKLPKEKLFASSYPTIKID